MNKIIVSMLAASCVISQLYAQTKFASKSISIFKNGKSFVVKEGVVTTSDKVYVLKDVPDALYGTLWFTGLQSDITKVISKQDTISETIDRKAVTFADLLYANKGKQITIVTNTTTYAGVVEDYSLPNDKKTKSLTPNPSDISDNEKLLLPEWTQPVLIKTNGKWITLNPAEIKTIEFSDKPSQVLTTTATSKKPVIKIHFAQGGEQKLGIMYLQNGISWQPVYSLELLSDTEARLKLQAEVTNDAEDIVNTDINFIVGVPNFKFATSPATLTTFVDKISLASDFNKGYLSNSILNTQEYRYTTSMIAKDEAAAPPSAENVDAEASEDLYFYNIKNVSLESGGRAHYPLLNTVIKTKHFFECNLPASNASVYNSNSEDGENDYSFNIQYCKVYHTIELKNDTQSPFTTGAVMITSAPSQNPLAQDIIKYTGKGLTSCIQLTEAPDIRVEEKEKIIATSTNIKKKDGYSYNMMTVQAEVTIVNTKAKEVELRISKNITGKPQAASIKYQSASRIINNNINPSTGLKFEVTAKAGEKQKFTYTYQVLVRS